MMELIIRIGINLGIVNILSNNLYGDNVNITFEFGRYQNQNMYFRKSFQSKIKLM